MTPHTATADDRPKPDSGREAGSILPFLVVLVGTLLVCAAFVVEFGGTLHAQQRANDLAAQAARTGGQQIALSSTGATPGSQTLTVDPYAARAAAQTYLTTAGVSGTVTVADAQISVTVTDTYQSPILGSITGPRQVSGAATARLVRTLAGTEHPNQ
jgi:Flp pilus assembly protein TadG